MISFSQLKSEKRRHTASISLFLIVFLIVLPMVGAQDVIAHRDLVIDLGNGLKTDAQLTLPVVGEGPFPRRSSDPRQRADRYERVPPANGDGIK